MIFREALNLVSHLFRIRACIASGDNDGALNLICTGLDLYKFASLHLLNMAHGIFCGLSDLSRYSLYQHRFVDFNIAPGESVLDMGSGHSPFPLATVLADISLSDGKVGRAGEPFVFVDGKPVYECDIHATPFRDKQFDFIYCSHVLEHVDDPSRACSELMRIAKRGYIEVPKPFKDDIFALAGISNHKWRIVLVDDVLQFTPYSSAELHGVGSDVMLKMNCSPRSRRERAFAALQNLRPDLFNIMFLWNGSFQYTVKPVVNRDESKPSLHSNSCKPSVRAVFGVVSDALSILFDRILLY